MPYRYFNVPIFPGEEVSEYAEHSTQKGVHFRDVFSHKTPFAIEDRLLGNSMLGTNHYMLDMGEGDINALLHDLGVE